MFAIQLLSYANFRTCKIQFKLYLLTLWNFSSVKYFLSTIINNGNAGMFIVVVPRCCSLLAQTIIIVGKLTVISLSLKSQRKKRDGKYTPTGLQVEFS